jgi:3-oxoadipate enol-lactonase
LEHDVTLVSVDGTELFVTDSGGDGPPVLFLHGFLFDGRQFAAQVAALADRYRCITLDFPGQGRSGLSQAGYGTEALTDLVTAFLEQADLGPVHLVGLSMGGFTGMRIAARRPGLLCSLALLNTTARPHARTKFGKHLGLGALARMLGPGPIVAQIEAEMYGAPFRSDAETAGLRQAWRERWTAADRAALVATLLGFMTRGDAREESTRIALPTLVIAGALDSSLPPQQSVELYRLIPGSRLVVLRTSGHSTAMEDPAGVTMALAEFWDEISNT